MANKGTVIVPKIPGDVRRNLAKLERRKAAPPPTRMADGELLRWIINNVLTESQLNIKPPGSDKTLRYR